MASDTRLHMLAGEIIDLAEEADSLALASDGPVAKTWETMDDGQSTAFFWAAYDLSCLVLGTEPPKRNKGDDDAE